MNSRFFAYLRIIRPLNVLIGAFSIFVGATIAAELRALPVFLACMSGAFIMAAGNVINDFFDVAIDRKNKPGRPLPAGQLQLSDAMGFAIILFTLGLFVSILTSFILFGLAFFVAVGLVVYSRWLKRTVLWGNVAVSLFAGLAFIYGGLSVENWLGAIVPGVFAFFFHLGREIIKDIEDAEADRAHGVRTLPIAWGTRASLLVATSVFLCLVALTMIPFGINLYGEAYLWIVIFGVDLVICSLLVWMWKKPYPAILRRVSFILKLDMLVGLAAILVGAHR